MTQGSNQDESGRHEAHPAVMSGWFAGSKAENGDWFADAIRRIVSDYYAWRRDYFPEDGVVIDSAARRSAEPFRDQFEDRLIELMGRLKQDIPFHSPRYAAHMLSEQSLPGIAGYFAAMLYNPNNVSHDAGPVTVKLELEAAGMIARMLGHTDDGWAHLTGGGTVANIEALWVARTVKYLPLAVAQARAGLGLAPGDPGLRTGRAELLGMSPDSSLRAYAQLFDDAAARFGPGPATVARVERELLGSAFHAPQRGMASIVGELGSAPVVLVPESHHYCFEKAMDVLGLGRDALVSVRVDPDFRMRPDDLREQLDRAQDAGRHILAVVAVIGSTEEGAVDPIDRILEVRAGREAAGLGSFWVHADAAYGGYLRSLVQPRRGGLGPPVATVRVAGAERQIGLSLPQHYACDALERMGECDSITVDPHKLGYVPYPAGCLSFRSDLVKPVVRQHAPYLADFAADPATERKSKTIGVYILEGSKPGAAAAAVWLSHTLIPLDITGHGALVRQTIRSACELHALLLGFPDLVVRAGRTRPPVRAVCLCAPGSNIVCYAFAPAESAAPLPLSLLNTVNEAIHRRFSVEAGRRVYDQSFFVSRTTLSAGQYSPETVGEFLGRLGCAAGQYQSEGVFLLRSVLMNPWYDQAKLRGRYFLSELVEELYTAAAEEFGAAGRDE